MPVTAEWQRIGLAREVRTTGRGASVPRLGSQERLNDHSNGNAQMPNAVIYAVPAPSDDGSD